MINIRNILLVIFGFLIPLVRSQTEEISFGEKHVYINTYDQYIDKVQILTYLR